MHKNKKLGCLSLLLLSPLTMAMQPLDDQSLSSTTGQDGLNIGIQSNVQFDQMAMIDKTGLTETSSDYTNRAGLVIAGVAGGNSPVRITGLNGTNETTLGLNVAIDTDAGTAAMGGAFANLGVSFADNVTGLHISPFSIYTASHNVLSSMTADGIYTRTSIFQAGTHIPQVGIDNRPLAKEILRTDDIDIAFADGHKPTLNIQLGAAPQDHMVLLGGALDSICGNGLGCKIQLVSNDATEVNLTTNPVGASFDLQLTGYNNSPFSLNGFYAGLEDASDHNQGAFIFGNDGTSDKFNLGLNNITLGTVGQATTETFNNLPNASMGNVGLKGASITDFKMRVSGL